MIAASSIRLATGADVHEMACLSRDAIETGLAWRWTPRRIAAGLGDAESNAIVARAAGDAPLLGFALMQYGDHEAHLQLLAVRAGQRRRGIGSALLQWLEATVAVAGLGTITLETRERSIAARAFYRRHGYEETALLVGYYHGLEHAVRLRKQRAGPG